MALVFDNAEFKHILRILNTNVDGREKTMYALTKIRGVGRRLANIACKKAEIDLKKRAGELTDDEIEQVVAVISNPEQFDIPKWFVNRCKDRRSGKDMHLLCNQLDAKLREDLERMKKIRCQRGLRHAWNLKVRGQHTKTTGRRGRTVGPGGK